MVLTTGSTIVWALVINLNSGSYCALPSIKLMFASEDQCEEVRKTVPVASKQRYNAISSAECQPEKKK